MRRWLRDERGATAIEYALIAAFVAILIISGARTVGTATNAPLDRVSSALGSSR